MGTALAARWIMHGIAADFRFALRMLVRRPVVAFIAIFTLALGMGAGTAMFSVVDAVLLRPLPYRDADRLVFVWSTFASSDGMEGGSALPDFRVWRDENRTLEALGGYYYREASLWSSAGEPERRQGAAVTAELFPLLGVAPRLGRTFTAEDQKWGQHRVALLSDGIWQDRFGGDPTVLGREITLNGRPFTVVGVMPPGMRFFDDVPKVDVFVPISFEAADGMDSRDNHFVTLVGRLRPDAEVAAAQDDLATLALRIAE
jgi:putative ABC transport system permease protein